ncbi:hypothetical protein DSL72_001104 [Monilinia vaccinii-corymbosi]|uniref:Uncharacterized protein n=1 Tax=Monilinia vaccinii-corymbosi TaxID=61207 RepID=A0A8A3PAI2_9HELO|nr:hypothetical protein DSL72_001104 [Monilinia vaccinii-corymbosi]
MAHTFASPCRSICHGLTNSHFEHEPAYVTTDHKSEYDIDVEAADIEDEEPQCEANRSIASPTQVAISPVITWQAVNTTSLGAAGVEIAEVDIIAQENIIADGHWHAARTSQIEPLTLKIKIAETQTPQVGNTHSRISGGDSSSAISGSQIDTSQATSVEPDKPSSSYPQMRHTLQLHPKKISKPTMNNQVAMPQLKANFRKHKKEYTSRSAMLQIKSLRYHIACLGRGNKGEDDSKMAVSGSAWASFSERRRWLKREMLRIKNLYTLARKRRQERIEYDLRASYDIAFIKSLEK